MHTLALQLQPQPSTEILRHAIIAGLRPALAGPVMALMKKDATTEEFNDTVRTAELMATDNTNTAVESLTDEIKKLSARLDQSTVRSSSTYRPPRSSSPSPARSQRHVSFSDRRSRSPSADRDRRRSPRPSSTSSRHWTSDNSSTTGVPLAIVSTHLENALHLARLVNGAPENIISLMVVKPAFLATNHKIIIDVLVFRDATLGRQNILINPNM